MGVCVWARVSAAPRHPWLGCWAMCGLVCTLRLHPATPGWGARCGFGCLGSGFGCAPPLLAGVLGCACLCASSVCTQPLLARVRGVCVCVWARVLAAPRHSWLRALLAPSHSWHGRAVWVCVFGLGFRLRPATPGWNVGLCVGSCARSACTPPPLAGVRGVGLGVWVRVSAAPRHSWLGCWAVRVCVRPPLAPSHSWHGCAVCVCVFGLGLWLRPATPGCALCWHPATPGTVARCGCVCFGSGFGRAPPVLAGVFSCVWARVRAPLAPRHSWLGCAVWLCVFGLGFRLRPPTPGWGVGVCLFVCVLCLHPATPGTGARCGCVCLGSGFGCAPPLLAGVCVVGVCARARVLAASRHSWLGFVVFWLAVPWHLFVCRGLLGVVRAVRVCGTRRPSLLGTCLCGLAVAGSVSPWRASWPRVVRRASSGPVALGAPVGFPVTVVPFPNPGACAPGFTGRLRGARGGRPRTGLFVPAAGPRRAPPLSLALPGFLPRVPWALALCFVCFVGLPPLGSLCVLTSFVPPVWPLAAPRCLLPPPPLLCLVVFVASARCCVPCVVLCCVSRVAVLRCAAARCVTRCCAAVCCVVLLRSVGAAARRAVPSGAARRPQALCCAALCFAVFTLAVCVLSLRGGVCCCSPLCFVLGVSWGAVLGVPCPLRSVRCCASLCW